MNRLITRNATTPASITTRIAALVPGAQANVFTATLSTGVDVRRSTHIERLGRWNPFPARVPLLDSHRRESVDSVVGFVDNIRGENGSVVADIHVSETRPNVAALIREGALRDLSIGFTAERWAETTEGGDRIRTGEGLTLRESSLVVIGADSGARLGRGEEDTAGRIRDLAETLRVPAATAEALVTRGLDFDAARQELVRAAAGQGPRIDGRSLTVTTREVSPADMARALGEAVAHRYGAGNTVSELGRPYTQDRFPMVCRRLLEAQSISTVGLSEASIVKRVLTTSDFPILVGEFLNQVLLAGYRAAPSPLMALVRNAVVSDFNEVHLPRLSQSPLLEPILESGEITFAPLQESEETFKVTRWGKGLMVSFVLLVNDRLGAIADQIRSWGRSVAETEAREIIRLLTLNAGLGPKLADTKTLYHNDHGNILTPAAPPSEESFDAARVAMRRMKDRFGELVGLSPSYVLVPPELETETRKLVATVQPAETEQVNAFAGWSVLVDARLTSTTRWYVFASPAEAPVFIHATLSGFEAPRTESTVDFHTDNVLVKTTHAFGFGVADYIGTSSNAGA